MSEIWENNAGFDIISEEGEKAPIHCMMLPDIDSINMAPKINVNAVVYKNDKTYSVCKFVSKKKTNIKRGSRNGTLNYLFILWR